MSIKINIFYPGLREYIGNPDEVAVTGSTVGECLNDFIRRFPGTEKWIFDERKALLEPVFVYVNSESTGKAKLSDPVKETDEIIIAMLLIGG